MIRTLRFSDRIGSNVLSYKLEILFFYFQAGVKFPFVQKTWVIQSIWSLSMDFSFFYT